ncbi:hypothetical protein GC089_01685 [Cellulomonas sp. JZ18]|uniref:hypothetical protein n=1 Tax=Cellulomonas sp. JZ18 TaxID=2654191 RepID=UPI0012D3F4EC|nr:hypothetical protein [Cellulomonas sp. JZ18]QGQ18215.1 hypothetical protein GC089_01685 [Cellulomonas sp. JZ18]
MSHDLAALAPHVDATWRDDLVVELRLHDVPGDAIGAALAEVEAHCLDSGQSAQEAFGDARAYGAALAAAAGRRDDEPVPLRTVVPAAVETLGIVATTSGAVAWLRGEPSEVHLAALVVLLAVGAGMVAITRWPTPVLRYLLEGSVWRIVLASLLVPGTSVAAALLAPEVAVELPAAPLAVLGLALLVTGTVLTLRSRARLHQDPVRSPTATARPGRDRGSCGRSTSRTCGARGW